MQLPGGIWHNGDRHRDFAFKPLTGVVELNIINTSTCEGSLPGLVTATLATALEHVGGKMPTPEHLERLCVADRQFLMQRLAINQKMDDLWLTSSCAKCKCDFDFFIKLSELPIKEAEADYPFTTAKTSLGLCYMRAPTGADQVAIAFIEDIDSALRLLVSRCIISLTGKKGKTKKVEIAVEKFTADDFEKIESALERISPEVTTTIQAECPQCRQNNWVEVDPYICLTNNTSDLLSEIHVLASTYHWSEAEILALPRNRRHHYLALVDRARGMSQ